MDANNQKSKIVFFEDHKIESCNGKWPLAYRKSSEIGSVEHLERNIIQLL